ncbi:MAG: DUF3293 domain-containing protein [Verrucomicrobiaceae bacterium]|nr:MAG: DUF3293 domain-containing protein [Verrucomicrobiaceae bacterium]
MSLSDFQRMADAYSKARFKDVLPPAGGLPDSLSIVTAWNPDGHVLPVEENEKRGRELSERLDTLGLLHFPVTGYDPASPHGEPGYGISCDIDTAISLGREFSQIAVFFIRSGTVHLVSCGACGEFEKLRPWPEMCD